MPRLIDRLSSYPHHNLRDQAFVVLDNKRRYLWKFEIPQSRNEYNRLNYNRLNGERATARASPPTRSRITSSPSGTEIIAGQSLPPAFLAHR